MKQLCVFTPLLIYGCISSNITTHRTTLAFDGPIAVYVGEGVGLDAAQTAIDWFNKTTNRECLRLYPNPWPSKEVPRGVITINLGYCGESLQGCTGYKNSGPVSGTIHIAKNHKKSEDILIAHEIAHILTNANDQGHTSDRGLMADPPNAWSLPPKYLANVHYACETKTMAPAIAKSPRPKSRRQMHRGVR